MAQNTPIKKVMINEENHEAMMVNPQAVSGASNFAPHHTRLNLLSKLQTTIDLDQLLTIFYQELNHLVGIGNLSFHLEDFDKEYCYGKPQTHQLSYHIETQKQLLGIMTISNPSPFEDHEIKVIEDAIAGLIYPLRNAIIHYSTLLYSFTDPVTHCGNRLAFEQIFTREFELARRQQHQLALLLLDLDGFKQINDRLGHLEGDKTLKWVAEKINEVCRNADIIFRYGGDEFVILMAGTDQKGALNVAHRLQDIITNIDSIHPKSNVTCSIGISVLNDNDTKDDLFKRADEGLYKAKDNGKNCICYAHDNQWHCV